jgi:hypothetical protein
VAALALGDEQSGLYAPNTITSRSCPAARERLVSFPEALELHLVELGYIAPEQSAALGYDPAKVEAGATPARSSAPEP